jgi:hypothetical protein
MYHIGCIFIFLCTALYQVLFCNKKFASTHSLIACELENVPYCLLKYEKIADIVVPSYEFIMFNQCVTIKKSCTTAYCQKKKHFLYPWMRDGMCLPIIGFWNEVCHHPHLKRHIILLLINDHAFTMPIHVLTKNSGNFSMTY